MRLCPCLLPGSVLHCRLDGFAEPLVLSPETETPQTGISGVLSRVRTRWLGRAESLRLSQVGPGEVPCQPASD
jgi:hypothetical protein